VPVVLPDRPVASEPADGAAPGPDAGCLAARTRRTAARGRAAGRPPRNQPAQPGPAALPGRARPAAPGMSAPPAMAPDRRLTAVTARARPHRGTADIVRRLLVDPAARGRRSICDHGIAASVSSRAPPSSPAHRQIRMFGIGGAAAVRLVIELPAGYCADDWSRIRSGDALQHAAVEASSGCVRWRRPRNGVAQGRHVRVPAGRLHGLVALFGEFGQPQRRPSPLRPRRRYLPQAGTTSRRCRGRQDRRGGRRRPSQPTPAGSARGGVASCRPAVRRSFAHSAAC
jgi:hypothetical protein